MTNAPPVAERDPELEAAYRESSRGKLLRGLQVAVGLSVVGIPGGFVLDYFLYPSQFGAFLAVRFVVAVLLLGIGVWLFAEKKRIGVLRIKALGVLAALVMNFAFCVMIYATNGAASPYFVGINLIMTCWAVMLPWSWIETTVVCVLSYAGYAVACFANAGSVEAENFPLFAFNSFFILITTAVCVAISVFLARSRFDDFRLRHELDERNRELRDLDRLKTQFFSNVSHELRTPLTLILSPVADLLRRAERLEPEIHGTMIVVQRNTLRLLKLINDLLDLTRMDQGVDVLRRKSVAVDEFLRGIVESVRHLGLSKRLKMKIENGPVDFRADFDPARIEKVILNLLTNAMKYTPAGGSTTVRWGAEEAGGFWFEVADTGVGIPTEDLARVFDRFHQVKSNAANQNQGVGIGLALAQELVEQHGGTLGVESVVGEGTTFRVTLPVSLEAEATYAEPLNRVALDDLEEPFEKAFRSADRSWTYDDSADAELPEVGSGSHVVLVADDEHDMRRYVVSLLAEDYRVVQTQHGGNVEELVAAHRPDLVVLDWMMPGKDGLELCRELRARDENQDLKIVLLTARADEESKIDALQAGADDFLTKPFSSIEVRTRVRNLLRAGQMQRDLRTKNDELTTTLDKLRDTETMLIQSEKMNAIGSMSAGLLHEINNPLNYTLTAMSIAKQSRETLTEDMREIFDDVEEGMTRIRDVVTDLKTFAYPEKVGVESDVAVAELLRNAMKIVAGELEGVRVDVELPEEFEVRGQKTQLMHIFINLLNNANRAMREADLPGERIVWITGESLGDTAIVRVRDSGPGVPEKIMSRIFDPFFTTRDVGSGMGMGLSICHTILNSHRGAIRVENHSEGGAVFTIELPLAETALISC